MRIWFLNKRVTSYAIQKRDKYIGKEEEISNLKQRIYLIDQKISQITKDLLQTQIIGIRTFFSTNNNWVSQLRKSWYGAALKESSEWHKSRLFELHMERRILQTQLDRISGKLWPKRIRNLILLLIILSITLFIFWIFVMGLMAAIYLLPIWGTIMLVYFFLKRSSIRHY